MSIDKKAVVELAGNVWEVVKVVFTILMLVTAGFCAGDGEYARASYMVGLAIFIKD